MMPIPPGPRHWGPVMAALLSPVLVVGPAESQQRVPVEAFSFTTSTSATPWRTGRPAREYQAEIGRITVPEVRADPRSRFIEIAFIRVPSRNPNPGPPTFIFPGGPGGSAIREVQWYVHLIPALLEVGDVIGVDQRGVGRSGPGLSVEFNRVLPRDEPTDPARILRVYAELAAEVRAHWAERGVDLAGYTTDESADDVDAVRRALGYDRITLLGFSYGSHLALRVVRRHGRHVAKLIVKGVEGPDHTFKTPDQIQEGLERVGRVVQAQPGLRREIPDFIGLVRRVLARVERGAVSGAFETEDGRRIEIPVTAFDVRIWLANAIGRQERLGAVPRMLVAMDRGDFSVITPRIVRLYRTITVWSALGPVADCASGMTAERARRIREEAPQTLLGDVVNFPYPDACASWDYPEAGDGARRPLRSDVPALFLAGDLDSRTPIGNAREVLRGFPNGTLVTVRNAGHDSRLFESDGTVRAVSRFLRGESIDEREIVLPPIAFEPVAVDTVPGR